MKKATNVNQDNQRTDEKVFCLKAKHYCCFPWPPKNRGVGQQTFCFFAKHDSGVDKEQSLSECILIYHTTCQILSQGSK